MRNSLIAGTVWLLSLVALFFILLFTSNPGEWWFYPQEPDATEGGGIATIKAFVLFGGFSSVAYWLGYAIRGTLDN
jgi:hypothetical protein